MGVPYIYDISHLRVNSVDTCAKSNHWYFRAQPPAYPCSIKIEATIRKKRSNSYISSRKFMKFVYLRKNSNINVLNMGYKLDLLQPKQEVFWQVTYSRSETSNAWKIPLEVRNLCSYIRHKLSVLIIGLNITARNYAFCEFALDLHSICSHSQRNSRLALSDEIHA